MSGECRIGSGTAAHFGRDELFSKRAWLACVEGPVTEVQQLFDPSILECPVSAAADIQASKVTGSSQPSPNRDRERVNCPHPDASV